MFLVDTTTLNMAACRTRALNDAVNCASETKHQTIHIHVSGIYLAQAKWNTLMEEKIYAKAQDATLNHSGPKKVVSKFTMVKLSQHTDRSNVRGKLNYHSPIPRMSVRAWRFTYYGLVRQIAHSTAIHTAYGIRSLNASI